MKTVREVLEETMLVVAPYGCMHDPNSRLPHDCNRCQFLRNTRSILDDERFSLYLGTYIPKEEVLNEYRRETSHDTSPQI